MGNLAVLNTNSPNAGSANVFVHGQNSEMASSESLRQTTRAADLSKSIAYHPLILETLPYHPVGECQGRIGATTDARLALYGNGA